MRVLVLTETAEHGLWLREGLADEGYSCVVATCLEDAVGIAASWRLGMILCQYSMHLLSGGPWLKRLSACIQHHPAPLVVMGGHSEVAETQARSLGADGFVATPCTIRELDVQLGIITRRGCPSTGQLGAQQTERPVYYGEPGWDVQAEGQSIFVSPATLRMFEALVRAPEEVLSRRDLVEIGFGRRWHGGPTRVDDHIHCLRRVLGSAARRLVSVGTTGYCWLAGETRRTKHEKRFAPHSTQGIRCPA